MCSTPVVLQDAGPQRTHLDVLVMIVYEGTNGVGCTMQAHRLDLFSIYSS